MTEQPVAPVPAAAASATGTQPTATSGTDLAAELVRLKAERDQLAADRDTWKGHARDWEGKAKTNKQASDEAAKRDAAIAKIAAELGLPIDTKPDPEAISRQLEAEKAARAETARELAVLRAAQAVGADGDALLDSRGFLAKLKGVDPTDTEAVKALVKATVDGNPKYAATAGTTAATVTQATAQPVARQASTAGDFNGSPGAARQLTAADVDRMTPDEVAKASRAGLLREFLAS